MEVLGVSDVCGVFGDGDGLDWIGVDGMGQEGTCICNNSACGWGNSRSQEDTCTRLYCTISER